MTTLPRTTPMPPAARYRGTREIHARLRALAHRHAALHVARGVLRLVMAAAFGLLTAGLLGYWTGQPPQAMRWGLLAGVLLAMCVVLLRTVWLSVRAATAPPAHVARLVEQALPHCRNDLVNAVLLARDAAPDDPFVQAAIDESIARTHKMDLAAALPLKGLNRDGRRVGLALLPVLLLALLQWPVASRGWLAVFQPERFVPTVNAIDATVTPGDVTVLAGEKVTLRLQLIEPVDGTVVAEVLRNDLSQPRRMLAGREGRNHTLQLPAVQKGFGYAVLAHCNGKTSRWPTDRPWYTLAVRELHMQRLAVTYRYPAYTARPDETEELTTENARLSALAGTQAQLQIRLSDAVPRGELEFTSGRRLTLDRNEDGRTFTRTLTLDQDDAWRLRFLDTRGELLMQLPNGDAEGAFYPLQALPDNPPTVDIIEPARDVTLAPDTPLLLRIRATDDIALGALTLYAGPSDAPPQAVSGFAPGITGQSNVLLTHRIDLPHAEPGEQYVCFVAASDTRTLPGQAGEQTTRSRSLKITIGEPARMQADAQRRLEELQRRLLEILKWQAAERVSTQILATRNLDAAAIRQAGKDLLAGQRDIHNAVATLAGEFAFDERTHAIGKALAGLAANETPLAIEQADVLATLEGTDDKMRACDLLAGTQDAIIAALQDMLAVLPIVSTPRVADEQPPGSDLTARQRQELREAFTEQLQDFIAEQRRAIQAGERLNKTTPEDFTPEDLETLKELAAVQDAWEKFLQDAFTDFSKLAEQDFSNPTMLKELISVTTDVTMARDALQKQALTIATAAEHSSVENAETLTANIEKWLPDEPDRKEWQMESLPDQQNTEQAELFSELEDLVGDLLEEEEDLFEEMDDLTSKSTMSGDKAIGWDAKDGPISNMNAQGVTGNQLPNTSEVSGRSGEGRTGKSAGEFVEDKAVGKGGRRTPTRMSDDPFQAGEVNDVSTDPPGGATGGGKLSGAGEEGLEGAAPKPLDRDMQRLAGQQASLINRAERIAANFKPGDYAGFRLGQAVLLMNRVREDLQAGEYRNALRRRGETLQAIRQAHRMLDGEVTVRQDPTDALPEYVRDDINQARNGKLPQQYRQAIEAYYRRISEQP